MCEPPDQKLALEFGATDIVTERGADGIARVKDLTGGYGAHQCRGGCRHPLELPLDQAAEGYRAMDKRRAFQVWLRP